MITLVTQAFYLYFTVTLLCLSFVGLPRQPSYTTGFGTALNIETLVAAAEQRDTPIEVGFVSWVCSFGVIYITCPVLMDFFS